MRRMTRFARPVLRACSVRGLGVRVGFVFALAVAACSSSGVETPDGGSPALTIPGVVNLDDAEALIEDLRIDPAIRAELSAELETQLGVTTAEAECLTDNIDVADLLAMSADAPDDGALERILEAFDACDVPRSVFEQ